MATWMHLFLFIFLFYFFSILTFRVQQEQQQQLRERHTHITDWILSVRECTLTVVHWKAVYTDSSFSSLVVSWRSRPPFYYFVFNCRCARCGNWNQEQVHVTWSNPLLGWMGDISGTAGTNAIRMLIISGANWIVGPVRARALPIGENNARTHAQRNSIQSHSMWCRCTRFSFIIDQGETLKHTIGLCFNDGGLLFFLSNTLDSTRVAT